MLSVLLIVFGCALTTGWLTGTPQQYNDIRKRYNFLEDLDNYEIIYLDDGREELNSEVWYDLTAFGNQISLRLQPNTQLRAPNFVATVRDGNNSREINRVGQGDDRVKNCYYLHKDKNIAAAVSLCKKNRMEGLLFMANETLEIYPLTIPPQHTMQETEVMPHIIRKTNHKINSFFDEDPSPNFSDENNLHRWKREGSRGKTMTIEAALFLDEPAYKIFAPFFDYDDEKLCDMLLAYINGVQALFHHPSLGHPIDIALIKMEIFKTQPPDLPHFNGERNQLLDSFCSYNEEHNPKGDKNPQHWDMGLYVSGLNFFAMENGRRSDVTMGLATVNGVCTEKYNCIIAEFGTTNVFGKPYPSAGFTSVYILAHEMGHNIGMHHDSSGNNCPKEGFIMSPSRGTNGETVWSPCSADVLNTMSSRKCLEDSPTEPIKKFDHKKYNNNPGQIWRAKTQCEVLIRDRDAELYNPDRLQDICENLQCKTPHRSGFYFAGPALQGTDCGPNKWCQGGLCVAKERKPDKIITGGWSNWMPVGECQSGCIKKSRGYQTRRRSCTQPKPVNTDEGCDGPVFDVKLCKDDKICAKRKTVVQYASEKCSEFSEILPDLEPKASGLQASHESGRPWAACAIFCKRKDVKMYYTPRIELNDLGRDPYFPDGTWCHNDGIMNYYCVQHHCLPELQRSCLLSALKSYSPVSANASAGVVPLDPFLEKLRWIFGMRQLFGRAVFGDLKSSVHVTDGNVRKISGEEISSTKANFKYVKGNFKGGDVQLPQNALPKTKEPSNEILQYFGLDQNGKPLLTTLGPEQGAPPLEDEWTDKDYLEIPSNAEAVIF